MFLRVLNSHIAKRFYSSERGTIEYIAARQIFDSRGFPTVQADVKTEHGLFHASAPSGSSTGKHEALELRDKSPRDYHGKGVVRAVEYINTCIGPNIIKKCLKATQQCQIDNFMKELDGTPNKANLGTNAILAVSMAVCRAGAAAMCMPLYKYIAEMVGNCEYILPVPAFNVINGGVHAGNKLGFQEFLIMPIGAQSFCHAMKMGTETYHYLKAIIQCKFGKTATLVADEGGFAPNISEPHEALALIKEAICRAGYVNEIVIAMDAAASEFYKDKKYNLDFKKDDGDNIMDANELVDFYKCLLGQYCILSIEDPFDQDDFTAWCKLTNQVKIQIVGDDLLVTNTKRIRLAREQQACNALLLKLNQIGTVTESIDAFKLAKEYCWGTMVSHRSGDTEDTFIADLVVGLGTGQIKAGAPCRSERLCKYNQLLRIEQELGAMARYAGRSFRQPRK